MSDAGSVRPRTNNLAKTIFVVREKRERFSLFFDKNTLTKTAIVFFMTKSIYFILVLLI